MEEAPTEPTNEEPKNGAQKGAPTEGPGTQAGKSGAEPATSATGSSEDPKIPTGSEGQERGPDGKFLPKDGAAPGEKTPPPPPKKWKLADKEFDNPDELATAAERLRQERDQAIAYKKFVEQAAEREKKAKTLEQRLKDSPLDAIREAGHDDYQLALMRVKQEMENARRFEGLSPEQVTLIKRAESLEQELERERSERRQEKEARDKEAIRLYREQRAQHYIGVINKAFEVVPELPKTGEVQVRLIQEMKRNLKYGYAIPADQLGRKVLSDLQAEHSAWDTDERFNAKDYVKKHPKRAEAIRAAVVESLQTTPSPTQAGQRQEPTPFRRENIPTTERREPLTPEEMDAIVRKRIAS